MSKRKTMDKAQARERRNRLLASAAAAELPLTAGVREMRAIAGMTQEEFARHRGVSARVIKAIELGQGNPTVATMNRIGQFFGLEVAFVPIKRDGQAEVQPQAADGTMITNSKDVAVTEDLRKAIEAIAELGVKLNVMLGQRATLEDAAAGEARPRTKKTPRPS